MARTSWVTKSLDVIFETHSGKCPCSYCSGSSRLHIGLNLPADRGKTSWRVIKVGKLYIRWTSPYVAFSSTKESAADTKEQNGHCRPTAKSCNCQSPTASV